MEAIIFGRGPTKDLIQEVPNNIFIASCSMHFPNADLIFAQDDHIFDKILGKDVTGFNTQMIFAPLRVYEKYAGTRVMLIDEDKLFPNSQGLSTGILAIGVMLKLGFKKLYLAGFDFTSPGGTIEKLLSVTTEFNKLYCIVEEPLLLNPPSPNFITKEAFYNGRTNVKKTTGD